MAQGSDSPALPSFRPAWVPEGRRLGRYRLGPSLGRGGMGEVFEAWDTLLNRLVAVKVLHSPNPNAILRFMKEAQLQARVSHPHVCRIYDVDIAEGTPFIAMQRVKGPSLFQVAPELSLEQAVEILAAVAQAMHAAHRVNLIHRDLKPSNILLEEAPGGGWVPYVADFGLAKDLEEDLTQTRGVMGTPSYMAPEQRMGESGCIGPATDIYSLGATLAVVLNLERRDPDPFGNPGRSFRGAAPRKLRTILRKCLEEDPRDRYATAGALAEDFRRFLDGEPLLAEGSGGFSGGRRLLRRHPVWAASLAITLVLGAAFALGTARLAEAGKRRTVLALRFALEARDLENSIGLERLHPVHDLRPVLAGMTEGLERIRKDIVHLGPEARGPGNLALGRGYLAMRQLEPALGALEEAWAAGYRTPDVAYALCKAHCDFCIRSLDQEQLGEVPPFPDPAGPHLKAAREFYARAAGTTGEPPELCGARILVLEHRGAEALVLARRLFEQHRWFYEAKVEEAYAYASLGHDLQRAGDPGGALALYLKCEEAARSAQAIGRSDITCYLAALDWRLLWLENPELTPRKALALWEEAEGLADTVLAIRPDSPRALSVKIHILLGRARTLKGLGRNPGPDLERAERFLAGAQTAPAFRWLLPPKGELIRRTREDLGRLS